MKEITPTTNAGIGYRAPKLIKRNMTLFVLSQAFNGAGVQLAYGFGPLMVIALTGSASLAGLIVGVIGASRFLISYTAGRITDRYGRRPGILLGQTLSLIGGTTIGASISLDSFVVFVIGLLIFGMGMSAAQQLRVAATDMFPSSRRAQALGYLALGSVIGLLIMPGLVLVTEPLAENLQLPHLGVPWLALWALIIPGMVMVFFVRPDPREIGMNLERYYPSYKAPPRRAGRHPVFKPISLYYNPAPRLAIISNCANRHGADLSGPISPRPFAHRHRLFAHVPCRRHVCLHHPPGNPLGQVGTAKGHVYRRRGSADRCRPGGAYRRAFFHRYTRHFSSWARLGGG